MSCDHGGNNSLQMIESCRRSTKEDCLRWQNSPDIDPEVVPLQVIENPLGHQLAFTRQIYKSLEGCFSALFWHSLIAAWNDI